MKSLELVVKIFISLIFGITVGFVTIPLSKKLTLTRTDDPGKAAPLTKTPLRIAAAVIGIIVSFGVVFTADGYAVMIRNLLLVIPIICVSFVDSLVRKIPNPLLLAMIAIDMVYIIYSCIAERKVSFLVDGFVGLFIGMLVCFIPSVLKIPMGAGDIKYSAVIGLCIGCWGYFQSMILMSVFVALFWVYLKLAKKGTIKTEIPMGPFLSIGTVFTMCFPLYKEYLAPGLLSLI